MRKFLMIVLFVATNPLQAQQLSLQKGVITDSVVVRDTIGETFSLYLPKSFDMSKKWPVVFVFDMDGKGARALNAFKAAAESQGYLLAASNNVHDSISITKNVLISSRMFNAVSELLPVDTGRGYTAGFGAGARFAGLLPTFVKKIRGVISCGAALVNTDVLSSRNPYHFVGIVGTEDYSYPDMQAVEKELNRLRFPNQLLVFDGGHEWPDTPYLVMALEFLTLSAMAKGMVPKDTLFIKESYEAMLVEANNWVTARRPLLANGLLDELIDVYGPFMEVDSLLDSKKALKKSPLFRNQNREQNALMLKETFLKEDYIFYLEEDIRTYNYSNLGWWNYQMEELDKFINGSDELEQQMGKRLKGFLDALIADNLDLLKLENPLDIDAMNFLYMLRTIVRPDQYDAYLNVISNSARIEDYGTALFYLEELLKQGFADRDQLYELEHTGILRITPEYNALIAKYLKDARYEINEE